MNQAYQIHYQIQTSPQGVVLQIWETLAENDEARIRRSSACLFRLNFRVESLEAAHKLLKCYLDLIGSFDIQETPPDQVVAITVYPTPTESMVSEEAYPYDRHFPRTV